MYYIPNLDPPDLSVSYSLLCIHVPSPSLSHSLHTLSQLKETPWDNELKNSDNHSLSPLGFCEGPLWGKPEIYFDEIISNMLVEHVTANDLKQFGNIYITFPFIFPANVGLHGMQIHPDRLLLPKIHKPIDIMRKYRSPSFTLIANIKIFFSISEPLQILWKSFPELWLKTAELIPSEP